MDGNGMRKVYCLKRGGALGITQLSNRSETTLIPLRNLRASLSFQLQYNASPLEASYIYNILVILIM